MNHPVPSPAKCGGCGTENAFILHNLRLGASYHRLCTDCVLRHYRNLFCPFCFDVYETSPPIRRVSCPKCPSIAHLSCATSSSSSFRCPPCSNPNFTYFSVNKRDEAGNNSDGGRIALDSAKALVAAAKIAAASMSKAATVARQEAEKKVKEAAVAKKRAKEALERVDFLVNRGGIEREFKCGSSLLKGKVDNAVVERKRDKSGGTEVDKDTVAKAKVEDNVLPEDRSSKQLGASKVVDVSPSGKLQNQPSAPGKLRCNTGNAAVEHIEETGDELISKNVVRDSVVKATNAETVVLDGRNEEPMCVDQVANIFPSWKLQSQHSGPGKLRANICNAVVKHDEEIWDHLESNQIVEDSGVMAMDAENAALEGSNEEQMCVDKVSDVSPSG